MLAPKWSAKVEYLHTSFDTHTFYTVFIPVNVTENNVNILRVGVNYHFVRNAKSIDDQASADAGAFAFVHGNFC